MPDTEAAAVTQAKEDVDRLASAFHEAYERLAGAFDYETRKESAVPWEEVPPENAALMRAVVTELLHRDVIRVGRRPQTGEPPMRGQTTFTPPDPLTGEADLG